MSGVGQEASGVGEHAYKAGQIAKVCQGDHLLLHAGLVVVEPPGAALLDLGGCRGILEAADDGADGLIVLGI